MSNPNPNSINSLNDLSPKLDAETRMVKLSTFADVNFNTSLKAIQYVQSGKELLRSANNYLEDNNIEYAYIFYLRYLTIFLEKLQLHPGYKEIPPNERSTIMKNCKLILPKSEKLKNQLLIQFREEHEIYLEKKRRQEEEDRLREDSLRKKREQDQKISEMMSNLTVSNKTSNSRPNSAGVEEKYILSPVAPSIYDNEIRNGTYSPSAPPPITSAHQSPATVVNNSFPSVDRTTKPTRLLSPISTGLRQLIIPGNLTTEFEKLADSNTRRNIETCGNLTGKIIGGRLIITHIIVPKQTGTANSCTTENELEIFEIQDKLDLISLGWIHTHPSQTAFLSSIDLHSSYCFQCSMPEAVGIVVAPTYNSVGIFTLSPYGMEVVGNCTETGFHPHPQNTTEPLFYEASHTALENERVIKIVDLRTKF